MRRCRLSRWEVDNYRRPNRQRHCFEDSKYFETLSFQFKRTFAFIKPFPRLGDEPRFEYKSNCKHARDENGEFQPIGSIARRGALCFRW